MTNKTGNNPSTPNIEFFLKFGKKEHIEQLLLHGEIFMKPMDYYRTCDNKDIRDQWEGLTNVFSFNHVSVFELKESGGAGKKIAEFSGKGVQYPTEKIEGNIYCLYSLRKEDFQIAEKEGLNHIFIDSKFDSYEYVAFIKADEFIRRFEAACQRTGNRLQHDFVQYLDYYKHNGALGPFHKHIAHLHQKEYRFFRRNEELRDLCFRIGSLEDICKIGSIKTNKQIRFAKK